MLALHDALDRLAELDPRKSRLVELRFFGGLGIDESAAALGVSPATSRIWPRHDGRSSASLRSSEIGPVGSAEIARVSVCVFGWRSSFHELASWGPAMTLDC